MTARTNHPLPVSLIEGETYAWCRCGLSQTMPLCDKSHKGGDIKPHRFLARSTETAYLCGCSLSEHPPFCDTSHCHLAE